MYNFKLDSGFSIDLAKSDKVFTPTGTSKVLVDAIIENTKSKKKVLEVFFLDIQKKLNWLNLLLLKFHLNQQIIFCYHSLSLKKDTLIVIIFFDTFSFIDPIQSALILIAFWNISSYIRAF